MADSENSLGTTPSLTVPVDPCNTYGLATQGFVWAAISSVSGDFGTVKSVNQILPDENQNVNVTSISSLDYAGDVNQINSDLSVTIGGEDGHRLLTDIDNENIDERIAKLGKEVQTKFDYVCSLVPDETTPENKLADKKFVIEEIRRESASFRGNWTTWSSVPTTSADYPTDSYGNKIPNNNDYIIVDDASELDFIADVDSDIIGEILAEEILTFKPGHVITSDDYEIIKSHTEIKSVHLLRSGTWRFRYVGVWTEGQAGKDNWKAEYKINEIPFTEEQWASINSGLTRDILTNIESTSGKWNNASTEIESTSANNHSVYTSVNSTSGNWNSVYDSVLTTSGKWNNASTEIESTSANNRSVYTSVNSTSSEWDSVYDSVLTTSGKWNNASTEIESTSANNRSVYTSVNSTSGNWDSVYTSVNSTSGEWDSVYSSVNTASGNWNTVYSTVKNTSSDWERASTEIESTSANNHSVYTSVNSTSGNWDSVYSTVKNTSSDWERASTEVESTSANNRSVYSSVSSTSGNWDSVYSTVQSASGEWNSYVYEGVRSNGQSDLDAINAIVGKQSVTTGSICIVKTEIVPGDYSYKAFVVKSKSSNGTPLWTAMDGNVSFDNVIVDRNLKYTAAIGRYDKPETFGTIECSGWTVRQLFEDILSNEDKFARPVPSMTVKLVNKSVEIGSMVTPQFNISYNQKTYPYGSNSNETINSTTNVAGTNYHISYTRDGSTINETAVYRRINNTREFTINGTQFEAKEVKTYINSSTVEGYYDYELPADNTYVPYTNLKTLYPDGRVVGSATPTVSHSGGATSISCYRMGCFRGGCTDAVTSSTITSAQIRGLSASSGGNSSSSTTGDWTIKIPVGTKSVVVAVYNPNKTCVLNMVYNKTVNADMTASFSDKTDGVTVNGNNGKYPSNDYTVWVFTPSSGAYAVETELRIVVK